MAEFSETKTRKVDNNSKNLTSLKVPPHSVEAEQAVLGGTSTNFSSNGEAE